MSKKKDKQLTTQEKLKIINASPELWLENFVKILNAENNLINFTVNNAQKHFLKKRDKYNIILKSRQLGFSTLSLGLMLFYAYQKPNTTYLMVAHDGRSLRELFNRLKMMNNSIPDAYIMKVDKNNREELVFSNGSRIIVSCPSSGLGAGMTLQGIHLSEYSLYNNINQTVGLATVEQALAKNKDSFIIIESTARGMQNNFYKLWQDSQRDRGRYKGFFFGWCDITHLDLFRYEVDLAVEWWKSTYGKGRPLSNNPLDTTPYEKELLKKTKVTLKQLMWRQWKLSSMTDKDFMQEYPAFPEQAFLSTNVGVFDAETIIERMNYINEPLKVVDSLPLSLKMYIGNGLNIYELPEQGKWYFSGVDVALGGGGGDYSSVCILNSEGTQVATFNRNDIPTYKFATIINDLGLFYNYSAIMVEKNSYGVDILQRLNKEKQYINLNKTRRKDKITGRAKWSHGWYQDSISKTIMVSDLKEAIETGLVSVNDRETLEQLKIYQEVKNKFGNLKGESNYDDLVDSLGLAVQSLKLGRYMI